MKKNITLLIAIFMALNLTAQWQSLGSGITESPREIFSISAISADVAWAVSDNPNFAASNEFTRTTDGGMTWIPGYIEGAPNNYYPLNIFALDENMAWVLMVNIPQQDRAAIFKTTDGGQTWTEQTGEFNQTGHAFAGLHFFNENDGLGFGSPGTGNTAVDSLQIFRTVDGGDIWSRIPPSELPAPMPGEGVWVYSGNNAYSAVADHLWLTTRANRVFKTTNKGQAWEAFPTGLTNSDGGAAVAFSDEMNGIATAVSPNQAAVTSDGGATWKSISIPNSPAVAAIQYVPGTSGTFIAGDGFWANSPNLLLTRDGGETWQIISHSPSTTCFQFLSPTVGWGGSQILSADEGGMYAWTGSLAAEGDWKQLPSFPTGRERTFSFVIGDKMYIGGGRSETSLADPSISENNCWAFDFNENTWTSVADLSGSPIRNSSGFTIDDIGYKVGGWNGQMGIPVATFFKYDPIADSWEQLPDFPEGARSFSISFVIGDKAYLACGGDNPYLNDFWSYNPATEAWTQLADFPGQPRWAPFGFSIGGKAYLGGGGNTITNIHFKDFYEYDPVTDTWTQLPDFPNEFSFGCFAFTIDGRAYIGEGATGFNGETGTGVWQFDPVNGEWETATKFEGNVKGRILSFSESYNGKGYVGGGRHYSSLPNFYDDFWEFDPNADPAPNAYDNWETLGTGISHNDHLSIFGLSMVDSQSVWGVSFSHDQEGNINQVIKTTDDGQTWETSTFTDASVDYSPWGIFALDDQTAFVPATNWNTFSNNLFKTSDGGNTWNAVQGPFANSTILEIQGVHFFDKNQGAGFGTDYGQNRPLFFLTIDAGDTWVNASTPPSFPNEIFAPNSGNGYFTAVGNRMWVGAATGGRIWRTTDSGVTWTAHETGLSDVEWAGMAFKDDQNGLAVGNSVYNSFYENRAVITTDGGETWSEIPIPQHPIAYALIYVPGTDGTFIAYDGFHSSTKILLTDDFGATWQVIDRGPEGDCIQFWDGRHGWAGGLFDNPESGGLYKWTGDLGGMLTDADEVSQKTPVDLFVYPNPASSSLFVRNANGLEISQLSFYNTLGQLVKNFPIGNDNALLQLDLSALPNGMYQLSVFGENREAILSKKAVVKH